MVKKYYFGTEFCRKSLHQRIICKVFETRKKREDWLKDDKVHIMKQPQTRVTLRGAHPNLTNEEFKFYLDYLIKRDLPK